MISRNSLSSISAPGSFPRRTLVAISQADAAETRITLRSSAMIADALRLSDEGESVAHKTVWVSSRTLNPPLHPRVSVLPRGGDRRKRSSRKTRGSQEHRAASSRLDELLPALQKEPFRGQRE